MPELAARSPPGTRTCRPADRGDPTTRPAAPHLNGSRGPSVQRWSRIGAHTWQSPGEPSSRPRAPKAREHGPCSPTAPPSAPATSSAPAASDRDGDLMRTRHLLIGATVVALATAGATLGWHPAFSQTTSDRAGRPAAPAAAPVWTGTWAASAQQNGDTFNGQTLRQVVHTSISGTAARVRLSNVFGSQPVTISNVHLARRTTGSSVDAASDRVVTFAGSTSVTIPAGQIQASDPVAFTVDALSDVAISFYLPQPTGPATAHNLSLQVNYLASGNVAGNATLSNTQDRGSYYFLAGLDVQNAAAEGSVVTLGASITDGIDSPGNANRRWPNDLAVRLNQAGRSIGVLNHGISGNGLLGGAGPTAPARFDRDVLSQPNVKWVIFSDDPINDLGANPNAGPQIITAMSQAIANAVDLNLFGPGVGPPPVITLRAHANGMLVTAENGGAAPLIANRTVIGFWEQFDQIDLGAGRIALRAHANNLLVTASSNGTGPLIASSTTIGTAETFDLIHNSDGSIGLRATVNGRYVCAEQAGAQPLIANRDWVQSWESFDLIRS